MKKAGEIKKEIENTFWKINYEAEIVFVGDLDCCERPRRKGAAITNTDIQADDIIKDIKFTYDSKRHNWNGYVKLNKQ